MFFPVRQSFLKLLVQEVEHMQFLLHKDACTKQLPDTLMYIFIKRTLKQMGFSKIKLRAS